MDNIKFALDDIVLVQETMSNINSRMEIITKDIIGKLPIMIAPMDSVINDDNAKLFKEHGLITFSIRKPELNKVFYKDVYFIGNNLYDYTSISLQQLIEINETNNIIYTGILVDIAHGGLQLLFDNVKIFKEKYKNVPIVVGNVANPETYRKWCEILTNIDSIRCSIGIGSACTSAANTGIFYPMGSLIKEIYDISKTMENTPKIIADGGVKNFDEINKLINLGADYVMCGNIFAKSLEACGDVYWKGINVTKFKEFFFKHKFKLYRRYRGMSTKEVQKNMGKKELRTSEGISFNIDIKYKLETWVDNFDNYLKSAMSYSNCRTLKEFKGKQSFIMITMNALKSFKK